MESIDYPVDVRTEYPERSSRMWAALTIFFLIKMIALIPHIFVLFFLNIGQWVVAFVAQFVVAFKGEYPEGMHRFVVGVLRWTTRVNAFALSVDDRYPPFSLEPQDDYPIDVLAERPAEPSRMYAGFTIIVQILGFLLVGAVVVWLLRNLGSSTWSASGDGGGTSTGSFPFSSFSPPGAGFLLRQIAALPHIIVLSFVGIAVFVLWAIVQWVILFVARFPRGMWNIVAGYVRWNTRVSAYSLGLIDRYPPFSMTPSLSAGGGVGAWGAAPPPPPPASRPDAPPAAPGAPSPQPPAPQGQVPPAPRGDSPAPTPEPPAPPAAPTPPPDAPRPR